MKRPVLDQPEFLNELNERLGVHHMYEEGMAFVAAPSSTALVVSTGVDWEGGKYHRTLFLEVAADVQSDFRLLASTDGDTLALDHVVNGFVEGEHVHRTTGKRYEYSVRFQSGPTLNWHARISEDGAPAFDLTGDLSGNIHAGKALQAAVAVVVETLIDLML